MKTGEQEKDADPEGANPPTVYRELWDSVHRACARAEVVATLELKKASAGDPRVAMEFLARRFPERWSKTDKVDVPIVGEALSMIVGIAKETRENLTAATTAAQEPVEE